MNGRSCKICGKGGCNIYVEFQIGNRKVIVYLCEDHKEAWDGKELSELVLRKKAQAD